MDDAHEGRDGLLASQGDAAEAFELVEEAFDMMTLLAEPPVFGDLLLPSKTKHVLLG